MAGQCGETALALKTAGRLMSIAGSPLELLAAEPPNANVTIG